MKDILSEIIAHKRKEVAERKKQFPLSVQGKELAEQPGRLLLLPQDKEYAEKNGQIFLSSGDIPFYSLTESLINSKSGIIAEFKRCSPSKGWLRRSADVGEIARGYALAGASALSVLTDGKYFGGSLSDLRHATGEVEIPVMRKEFIIDEYQLFEAKLSGASAVLLIAAAITKKECERFTEMACRLRMEVLLELHDEREIDYITPLNTLIGVNNRDLGRFVTDPRKSFTMAPLLPKEAVWVSESGLSDAAIVKELRDAGYRGFLIGGHFMNSADPGQSLKEFIDRLYG